MEGALERLVRWIIVSNQPFTEIENIELRELLIYLRPSIEKELPMADALKERVMHYAAETQVRLANLLAVCTSGPLIQKILTHRNLGSNKSTHCS